MSDGNGNKVRPEPEVVLSGITVMSAEGTFTGDMMSDDSIRITSHSDHPFPGAWTMGCDGCEAGIRSPNEVGDMMRQGSSFDALLYRLIQKADSNNRGTLMHAFPKQFLEFSNWFHQDLTR